MLKQLLKLAGVGLLTVLCLVGALMIWVNKPKPLTERPVRELITYNVVGGDTIWEIATHYIPEDGDIRLYIWEIERLNGRKLSRINAGETIIIPLYEEVKQ